MSKWIVIAFLLLCTLVFATTAGSVIATHKQIQEYLNMPAYVGVVPENVRAILLERLPIGSSQRAVQSFLSQQKIGIDHGSTCSLSENGCTLACQLGTDYHSWDLVRERFTVSFAFGSSKELRDITVRSAFSSPLFGEPKSDLKRKSLEYP